MYELTLAANAEAWRLFMLRRADPAFRAFSLKVFRRDRYVCQFCGFQARDYQEVINLDQNYRNNALQNMTTACCFCSQCFFLQAVGLSDYGGGTLIYLPEITQSSLNSFCHVLFCAITNDTGYSDSAQSIYRDFKLRSQQVEAQFGDGASNPAFFGQLMIETQEEPPKNLTGLLKDLRLLPSRAGFRMQIEHWAALALQELAESK
ncbi:MAG: HNH endonuclease [Gammaproteobacteria bacterium]|nr:HNH endonuclease [Gammaproteobacteria bacterium]